MRAARHREMARRSEMARDGEALRDGETLWLERAEMARRSGRDGETLWRDPPNEKSPGREKKKSERKKG